MVEAFDIFKMGGTYVWKAAAESFEAAKSKTEQPAATSPGEYLIFDQATGNKTIVTSEALKN
jgi:hypothetical protein